MSVIVKLYIVLNVNNKNINHSNVMNLKNLFKIKLSYLVKQKKKLVLKVISKCYNNINNVQHVNFLLIKLKVVIIWLVLNVDMNFVLNVLLYGIKVENIIIKVEKNV